MCLIQRLQMAPLDFIEENFVDLGEDARKGEVPLPVFRCEATLLSLRYEPGYERELQYDMMLYNII